MKQLTFADAEYAGKRKQTRRELFLIEMDRVVPWPIGIVFRRVGSFRFFRGALRGPLSKYGPSARLAVRVKGLQGEGRMFSFDTLWKSHPEIFGDAAPCRANGAKNFSGQCAINLGVALRRAGADLGKLKGVRHWFWKVI